MKAPKITVSTPGPLKVWAREVSRETFDELAALLADDSTADAHVENGVLCIIGAVTLKVKE